MNDCVIFGVKTADHGQELIAHHCEPDAEDDSNTACVDCDSNTISVGLSYKIASNDRPKVNFLEPLSQLHHAKLRTLFLIKVENRQKLFKDNVSGSCTATVSIKNKRAKMIKLNAAKIDIFCRTRGQKNCNAWAFFQLLQ